MWFSEVIGAWHPRLVPFPIVLLLASLVLDLVGVLTRHDRARWAGRWLMCAGTVFLLLAFICGINAEIWAGRAGVPHQQIEFHELAGTVAAWAFIGLTAWRLFLDGQRRRLQVAYLVAGFALYGAIAVAGYRGGELVQQYGAAVPGAEARTVLSLHDLNTLAQRQTERNLQYSDRMHHAAGALVLVLTLSLVLQTWRPALATRLGWVMPTLVLGGGLLLVGFADRDLYDLADPRQFLDREAQMHKLLGLTLAAIGVCGFFRRRQSGRGVSPLLPRIQRRDAAATLEATATASSQDRLVAVMALIGGGALFTHVHTVAPYANVAAGVYLNHIVLGAVALAIGAVKLLADPRPARSRWRSYAFPGLLLVECFLLLTYTEGLPWWAGGGHYNRRGPNGGAIAPFGNLRAELLFQETTGQLDLRVLDRFTDESQAVTATNLSVIVARRYQETTVPLAAVDATAGRATHFRGNAPFLKNTLQFDARMSLPIAGRWRTSRFDPWVIPTITGIPPNELARYVCPMHEGVRAPDAGDCPLCGMPLVPIRSSTDQLHEPEFGMDLTYAHDELRLVPRRAVSGEILRDLRIVHEHPLHLIIVGSDLGFFDHVHPLPQPDGSFRLPYQFPVNGSYLLFADITPAGHRSQVFRLPLTVATRGGNSPPPEGPGKGAVVPSASGASEHRSELSPSPVLAREIGAYHIALLPQPRALCAGRETQLAFRLEQAGKPVLDLEPYLGAMGHCVIISEDTQHYLHCHPEQFTAPPAPQDRDGPTVTFHTVFPRPGRYKIWGQFKRGNQIIVADFVVDVARPLLPPWLVAALLNE